MAIKSALGRQFGTQFDSVFDVVKSNPMYDKSGGKIPSLDLNFAKSKSLRDSRSTKNLINFTRASTGTYVDSDGLIKTVPVNKLLRSNEFTSSSWVRNNETLISSAATAPDGTATATTFTFTQNQGFIYQDASSVIGQSYVTSIWIKGNANATLGLRRPGRSRSLIGSDGTVAINVTTEWQKFTAVTTSADNTSGRLLIDFRQSSGAIVPSGFEVSLWHAQTEEGTTATDYIPTGATISGAPRFDHDPVTGESLGLLIEEQRTNKMLYSENLNSSTIWRTQDNSTTTLSSITSPDGVSNMWLIDLSNTAGTSSAGSRVYQNNLAFNSQINTFSFYARSVSGTGTFPVAYFIGGGGGVGYVKSYVTLTEETQRYEISCPAGIPTASNNIFGFSRRGDTHDETLTQAYVWGCQVERASFASSYIKTENSTVMRSPDLTTIEGNKFAKTNLLEYSERFDEWSQDGVVTTTPNATLAPDGTQTADLITVDAGGPNRVNNPVNIQSGSKFTFSFYFKNVDINSFAVRVYKSGADAIINLDATTLVPTSSSSIATVSVVDASDGWKRVVQKYTNSSNTGVTNVRIGGSTENSAQAGSFYIWGAQLEEGDDLTEYTPSVESFVSRASSATYVDDATGLITTAAVDAARYENGELLLEPARTNLLAYSEQLDQWIIGSGSSITANQAVAPNGTNTADRVQHGSSGTSWIRQTILNSGNTYTISVYAKAVTPGTNNQFSFNAGPNTDPFIATSEWQRFSATLTATGNHFYLNNGDDSYSTDVYFWGFQVEQASFPTSYIPTTSSTVTRSADISTSALGVVDSWYNQSEGTVFSDHKNQPLNFTYTLNGGNDNNRLGFTGGTANGKPFVTISGSLIDFGTSPTVVAGGGQLALGYKASDYGVYGNGIELTANSGIPAAVPTGVDELSIGFRGSYQADQFMNGHISRLAYFSTRLSDDKLKSITT